MNKKTLQQWYLNNDLTYDQKEELSGIGIEESDYYLEDLKQILRCAEWAKENSEIKNSINGKIKKIIFFTPNLRDGTVICIIFILFLSDKIFSVL